MAIAKLTTLTPVHIGSGTTYNRNIDFVQEGGRIGIVDANKVAALIGSDKEAIDQWVSAIDKGTPLMDFLRINRGKKEVNIDNISERVCLVLESSASVSTLKEQVRSAFEGAYFPGSSLKGAIRTAIFNRLIIRDTYQAKNHSVYREERKDKQTQKVYGVDYKGVKLEKKYLGNDANHDIMRLLRVGDAHFGETICLLAKTLNEVSDGHEIKNNLTQLVECVPANAETICQFSIPDDLIRQIKLPRFQEIADKMRNLSQVETWIKVFELINAHTKLQIQKEITRYENANLPNQAAQFLPFFEELKEQFGLLSDKECIVRVGFGTGYLSMTGGWALEQWKHIPNFNYQKELENLGKAVRKKGGYENMALPKSRKIGYEGVPLGFIKISLLTLEEAKAWKDNQSARQAEKIQKQAQAAEEARLKAEQEAEIARIAAEEAKKPKLYEGKLKVGAEMDAEIVMSGKPNKMKIYVAGHENDQIPMIGYTAAEPVGKVMIVTVNILGKDGKVKEVRYKKFK